MKVVDKLKYILGLDIKDLQKNAAVAEKRIDTMSDKMGTAFKRIGAAIIAYMGARQLAGFIKSVTLTAARVEELGVVLENVGRTAGYSAQYLAQEEEKIKALGITTQATRMLMIRFMQSQLDVAMAAKIARAAQDFAVIGMVDSSEAAKMLTFAIAAQRPRLLRQFGIVTDLAEVFNKYAKTVGKSAEDLTEHEKRMSFYNVIMENAARITGTYEAAMMTAGKQFRSLQRYVEEAASAIGKHFLPVFSELVVEITGMLKEVQKLFDPLGAMISEYTKLKGVFDENTGSIYKLAERYEELTKISQYTKAEHEEYARIVDKLIALMPELSREYDAYGNIIIGNADALREVIKLHREELSLKKEETVEKLREEIKATTKDIAALNDRYKRLAGGKYAEFYAKIIKSTTEQLIKHRKALIKLQGQLATLETVESLYGPPKPEEIDKVVAPMAKALLDQMLWKLDLDRKYEKITLAQHKIHLQSILAAYNLTEEQRIGIKKKITEIEYQIEADMVSHYKAEYGSLGDWVNRWLKGQVDTFKDMQQNKFDWLYEHEQISAEQYVGFLEWRLAKFEAYSDDWITIQQRIEDIKDDAAAKEKERWEEQHEVAIQMYQAIGDMAGKVYADIFTAGKSLTQSLEEGWRWLMNQVVGIFADMLAKFITTSLLELARHTATEKAKTAVTATEAAKRAALTVATGGWGFLMPFKKGGLVEMQQGGLVAGIRSLKDNVLAALSVGEYVLPRRVVAAVGVPALEHMRRTGEVPGRQGGNVYIDMGGFTFSGTKRADAYLIETFVEDKLVEVIEEKLKDRDLVL